MNTQIQEGGNDCGLFAIATATTLCHGEDPVSAKFDAKSPLGFSRQLQWRPWSWYHVNCT